LKKRKRESPKLWGVDFERRICFVYERDTLDHQRKSAAVHGHAIRGGGKEGFRWGKERRNGPKKRKRVPSEADLSRPFFPKGENEILHHKKGEKWTIRK